MTFLLEYCKYARWTENLHLANGFTRVLNVSFV